MAVAPVRILWLAIGGIRCLSIAGVAKFKPRYIGDDVVGAGEIYPSDRALMAIATPFGIVVKRRRNDRLRFLANTSG